MSDVIEVWLADDTLIPEETRVGVLTRSRGRSGDSIRFEYDLAWLDPGATPAAFAIDPDLPLSSGSFHPPVERSLPGIFLDMAPDRWGRVLMERREVTQAKDEMRDVRILRDWDFLTGVNDATRMGGLRLWNPSAQSYVDSRELGAPPLARLRELEDIVARLDEVGAERQPEYRNWLRTLVVPGTSLGGARPKASFSDDDGSTWIAKFPASDDRRDIGLLEFLAHDLAVAAGIDVPIARRYQFSTRGHTFAVKRFDRSADSRRVYASA
ncbi:MAG: HipA domain-containing protein, partial [Dokdonella sp.]